LFEFFKTYIVLKHKHKKRPLLSGPEGGKSNKTDMLSVLKVLRILRVLRPLRAINRAKGLKVKIFYDYFFII
jgi:hypothetical protein